MTTRQDYLEKIGNQLDAWEKDVKDLEDKLHHVEHDFKESCEHKVHDAKAKYEHAKTKLYHLTHAADDAWDDVKDGLEIAWDGLKLGILAARSEFEATEEGK